MEALVATDLQVLMQPMEGRVVLLAQGRWEQQVPPYMAVDWLGTIKGSSLMIMQQAR
jgi:fermentation-respiration switch protein FrsA (DUF1100 family)